MIDYRGIDLILYRQKSEIFYKISDFFSAENIEIVELSERILRKESNDVFWRIPTEVAKDK